MPERANPPANDPELSALAGALRALAPQARLDRDALLFRAGAAAAQRPWLWPAATLLSAGVALALGLVLLLRPSPPPQVIERVVVVPAERPAPAPPREEMPEPPPAEPYAPEGLPEPASPYRKVEEHLLRWGLEGLGEPADPPPAGKPPTVESLLNSP
jgi:hypothetical protein